MGYLIGVPIMATLAVLQASLISHLRLLDGRPDLVLLGVLAWALLGRGEEAMFWGFTGGLFLDLLSSMPIGPSSVALVLVALAVATTESRLWGIHPLMQLAASLLASSIFYSFALGALFLAGRSPELPLALTRIALPGMFLNMLLVMPITQLAEGLEGFLFPARMATG